MDWFRRFCFFFLEKHLSSLRPHHSGLDLYSNGPIFSDGEIKAYQTILKGIFFLYFEAVFNDCQVPTLFTITMLLLGLVLFVLGLTEAMKRVPKLASM